MKRLLFVVLLGVAIVAAGVVPATGSGATADAPVLEKQKGKGKKGKGKRDRVHEAWPHKKGGKKPNSRLARRLARQIGPVRIPKRLRRAEAVGASLSPQALRARTPGTAAPVPTPLASTANKLLLVRSFDIPKDDRFYADLTSFSWTYDNALATIGFVADGDKSQARQLLDQLAVLQSANGSWKFAFDVSTGRTSEVVRSGAVAWVALGALAYAERWGDKTYHAMIGRAIDYLLSLRNAAGLITGGPDVSWASTQHNLLAAEVLREAAELTNGGHRFGSHTATSLGNARKALETAVGQHLLVVNGSTMYFRQGQGDNRIPIDVQALGTMYLESRNDYRAAFVAGYMLQSGWYIAPRTTTAASTRVSGLRPFLDAGSPDLIWTEGTIEAQTALTRVGAPVTHVATAVRSLRDTMSAGKVGPIGADRTSDNDWGQFRTWPTSAAASWLLILELEDDAYLFAD